MAADSAGPDAAPGSLRDRGHVSRRLLDGSATAAAAGLAAITWLTGDRLRSPVVTSSSSTSPLGFALHALLGEPSSSRTSGRSTWRRPRTAPVSVGSMPQSRVSCSSSAAYSERTPGRSTAQRSLRPYCRRSRRRDGRSDFGRRRPEPRPAFPKPPVAGSAARPLVALDARSSAFTSPAPQSDGAAYVPPQAASRADQAPRRPRRNREGRRVPPERRQRSFDRIAQQHDQSARR